MSVTIRMSDGDLEIDSAGAETVIGRADKAAQDLLEELFLPYDVTRDRGNEMFNPDGSLATITGSMSVGEAAIKAMIKATVTRFMRAQAKDPDSDPSELIRSVSTLLVQALNNDPTRYGFFLGVKVDDELIALARAISTKHLGDTNRSLVGGYDL